MQANEMIERYVHQVGMHLPQRNREDIQQELQSLLQDAVDERAGGKEAKTEVVSQVLREFGKPQQIASQYRGSQHLIGPNLYCHFQNVTALVWSILTGLFVLVLGITLWRGGGANVPESIWELFLSYGKAAITSLGIITLIFAAIERYFGDEIEAAEYKEDEWDPLLLPPVNDPNRVSRGEVIGEVVCAVTLVTVFLSLIGPNGVLARFVVAGFSTNLPWLVAAMAIGIVLKLFLIRQGTWTPIMRWLEIASLTFNAYVLYRVVASGPISTIARLNGVLTLAFGIMLTIVLATIATKVGRQLWNWQLKPTPWRVTPTT